MCSLCQLGGKRRFGQSIVDQSEIFSRAVIQAMEEEIEYPVLQIP